MSYPSRTSSSTRCRDPHRRGEPPVGVARVGGAFRVVATRDLRAGSVLLELRGELVGRPSRLSVQVDALHHIEVPRGTTAIDALDLFPWQFLNHSCHPSAVFRERVLVALYPIRAWDEVTFDYNTTEYDLAEPFECGCGALTCVGEIRGFRHLTRRRRGALREWAAPHVLALKRIDGMIVAE